MDEKLLTITGEEFAQIVFALFFNLNLRVYDNGMSMADNVLNIISE